MYSAFASSRCNASEQGAANLRMIDDVELANYAMWGGYAMMALVVLYHYLVAPRDSAI